MTVCLEPRHVEWLELRARIDKAERQGAPEWTVGHSIERILRQAYAQDPARVSGASGPKASFNPGTGGWDRG